MYFKTFIFVILSRTILQGQEARFAFGDPITFTAQSAYTGRAADFDKPERSPSVALKLNLYPTLKLGSHWFAYGAVQVHSTPFIYSELGSNSFEIQSTILQAYAGYTRVAEGRSVTVKVGQLSSAFGSYPLRYDDARNWLIDSPSSYGYYAPVSLKGLPGAEMDVVLGKADLRFQFTNSSPGNPRQLWDSGQFGSWTAGAGYTIRQGFRVGASAYRGPYLNRDYIYFFPGEADPKSLPATGLGVDVQYARGRLNLSGEAHKFLMPYRAIPDYVTENVYGEAKVTLSPRWFVSGRIALSNQGWTHKLRRSQTYEGVVAFRPARNQLVKLGYLAIQNPFVPSSLNNVLGLQYVVTFDPPAVVFDR